MTNAASLDALILTIRDQKVLLDTDLAEIYGVPTKALNQAVKRNADRFPEDFRFQLTASEKAEVVTNCDHLSSLKFSKSLPHAFTEHGALMAANVLNSPEAVKMSVHVVRAFIKQRELIAGQAEILNKLAQMDAKLLKHDDALRVIWQKVLIRRRRVHFTAFGWRKRKGDWPRSSRARSLASRQKSDGETAREVCGMR